MGVTMVEKLRSLTIPEAIMLWNQAKQSNLAAKYAPQQYEMQNQMNQENLQSANLGNQLQQMKIDDYPKMRQFQDLQNDIGAQSAILKHALMFMPTLKSPKEWNSLVDKLSGQYGYDLSTFKQDENVSPEQWNNFKRQIIPITQQDYAQLQHKLELERMGKAHEYRLGEIDQQNQRYENGYGGGSYASPMVSRAYQDYQQALAEGNHEKADWIANQYGINRGSQYGRDKYKDAQLMLDISKNTASEMEGISNSDSRKQEWMRDPGAYNRKIFNQMMGVSNKTNVPASTKNQIQSKMNEISSTKTKSSYTGSKGDPIPAEKANGKFVEGKYYINKDGVVAQRENGRWKVVE